MVDDPSLELAKKVVDTLSAWCKERGKEGKCSIALLSILSPEYDLRDVSSFGMGDLDFEPFERFLGADKEDKEKYLVILAVTLLRWGSILSHRDICIAEGNLDASNEWNAWNLESKGVRIDNVNLELKVDRNSGDTSPISINEFRHYVQDMTVHISYTMDTRARSSMRKRRNDQAYADEEQAKEQAREYRRQVTKLTRLR